jgi:hypothetical protein
MKLEEAEETGKMNALFSFRGWPGTGFIRADKDAAGLRAPVPALPSAPVSTWPNHCISLGFSSPIYKT